jgi:hypothetical protein
MTRAKLEIFCIHLETKLLAQEILWSHGSYLSHLFKHVIAVHTKYCIQIARVKIIVICYDTCITLPCKYIGDDDPHCPDNTGCVGIK